MYGDGDLELVLRWDRHRRAFDVNVRFDVVASSVDQWLAATEPLTIDIDELNALQADEPEYGKALTRMLLRPDDIGPFVDRALGYTESSDVPLHMRLHLAAPPRFHAIRWESLRHPRTGTPIATRAGVLLSRFLSSPDWRPIPALPKHDLRALVVVAGPRLGDDYRPGGRELAPVDVDAELDRARAALSDIPYVQSLVGPAATFTGMMDALDKGVDILYLVCHGAIVDGIPVLVLEGDDRAPDVVDGRKLVDRLSEVERRPTVAVLGSCQSAAGTAQAWSTDDGSLVALGPRLASTGVAAVIAMQGNVSMATATRFMPAFFSALARTGVVDAAMATARRTVSEERDWWVPVLYSRLRSGRTYYRPAFTERSDRTWASLDLQLERRAITPVLGPGLAAAIIGSRQRIARRWVERWQMPIAPHDQGDLAKVAQYLRVRSSAGHVQLALEQQLVKEMVERQANAGGNPIWDLPTETLHARSPVPAILEVGRRLRQADEGDPYRVMAGLDVDIYVTTSWTDLLQEALKERGRQPITMMFPWRPSMPKNRVQVSPTPETPLVYHLYGRLDDVNSLVLSEDDYFAWLSAWISDRRVIPPSVQHALTAKPLLFLGYSLDDWDFRVIFHSIKSFGGHALHGYHLHVGVQLSPQSQSIEPEAAQEYLESYFGDDKISIYWGDTRQFLDELRARGILR